MIIANTTPWYEEKLEGWYYFQSKEEEEEKLSPHEAEVIMEKVRENLKELLSLALLVPTEENVSNYLREQKRWSDQSSLFASTWEGVLKPAAKKEQFLLFCFKGKESTSPAAIQAAIRIAEEQQLMLKAVSLDGETLGVPDCVLDQGISKRLGVEETPALYLIDPLENKIELIEDACIN